MRSRKILISCEHAGNYIPKDYAFMFAGAEEILASHRGWDPGSLTLAKYLARHLKVPLFYQKVSRLLVEVNRSLHNKELFSEFTHNANWSIKEHLLKKYYHAYRDEIEQKVEDYIAKGDSVLHISVHTFTPVLNGIVRSVDLGLLFDETKMEERAFCDNWQQQLNELLPNHVVMLNCPYNGADDGLTTYLRTKFTGSQYLGVEIEINNKYINSPDMNLIQESFSHSLSSTFITS